MTTGKAAQFEQTAAALRYTLAVLDEIDRQLAGAAPSASGVTMTADEAIALAPVLAHLVIAGRAVVAKDQGAADWSPRVRAYLESELEQAEVNAAFARVEAEERRG